MICEAENANVKILGKDPLKDSPDKYLHLYEQCVNALKAKCSKPRDQQLQELLSTCYTMCQQQQESVANFAHRFTESLTQNELEKLLPKIHRTPDAYGNTEVELITAFTIKLREPIAKELISGHVKYSSLQALISAAEHFKLHLPSLTLASTKHVEDLSTWESALNYPGTFPHWHGMPQSRDTGYFNHAQSNREHSTHKVDKLNSSGINNSSTRSRPINFFQVVHLRKTKKFVSCFITSNLQLASSLTTNVQIIICTSALSAKNGLAKHVIISHKIKVILTSLRVINIKVKLM